MAEKIEHTLYFSVTREYRVEVTDAELREMIAHAVAQGTKALPEVKGDLDDYQADLIAQPGIEQALMSMAESGAAEIQDESAEVSEAYITE